jgi:hypothetical protein
MMTAAKFDNNKPPLGQLPLDVLEGVADVCQFGATKYSMNNWRKGMSWSKILNSCLRHITKWQSNIDLDEESKLHHLDHAIINLMYLRWYTINRIEFDDRYKEKD